MERDFNGNVDDVVGVCVCVGFRAAAAINNGNSLLEMRIDDDDETATTFYVYENKRFHNSNACNIVRGTIYANKWPRVCRICV